MAARIDAAGLRMLVLAAALSTATGAARGQSSSLYGDPQMRHGLTMNETSWIYESPADPKQFKLNDQITIVVNENSAVTSKGTMDRQKLASMDAILSKWVLLNKFSVVPDPQSAGSPEISASLQNQMQSQAELQTKDTMLFKIACRIADRRPNGLLVIEGHRTIQNNNEIWEQSLSGVIRPQDVQPNNSVLSENVAELRISKREAGHVRDGYRRGWLLKAFDKYQLF
jgi:flagellar L-ring protein precursor FlgH